MRPIAFCLLVLFSTNQSHAGEPPFSSARGRPSMSPYLFLDPNFNLPYQTVVRPMLQQHHATGGQVAGPCPRSRIAEAPAQNPQGIRPTGHRTYFMLLP